MSSRQVKEYLSHHHISQMLESLLTGLLFHQPEDPLRFLQDALQRTRTLGGPEAVSWDTFIHQSSPPTSKTAPAPQITPHAGALLALITPQIPQAPPRVLPPTHSGPPAVSMKLKAPILPPLTSSVHPTFSTHKTLSDTTQPPPEHTILSPPKPELAGPLGESGGAPSEPAGAPPDPTGVPLKVTGSSLLLTEVMQRDTETRSKDIPPGPGSSSVLPPGPLDPGSSPVLPHGLSGPVVQSQLSIESDSDMTESSGLLQEVSILPAQRPRPLIIFIIASDLFLTTPAEQKTQSQEQVAQVFRQVVHSLSGGPGSGKGSQTAKLTDHFDFRGISVDELLRRQLLTDATPGRRWELMSELMSQGELGTQEDMVSELRRQLIGQQEVGGVIVDGFPRDVHQALSFQEQVGSPDLVMMLVCSKEMLRGRLQRRAAQLGLLGDSNHTLQRRLDRFQRDIVSISRYYRQLHLLTQVDADRDAEVVFADLSSVIREKLSMNYQILHC